MKNITNSKLSILKSFKGSQTQACRNYTFSRQIDVLASIVLISLQVLSFNK